MMREIKFRALHRETNNFVYGFFVYCPVETDFFIVEVGNVPACESAPHGETISIHHPIDHKTLGQYAGLKDKNEKPIFEGDIVARKGEDFGSNEYNEWANNADFSGDIDDTLRAKIPIINRCVDVVTMDRFPVYWLKNESFGYEGEDLEVHEEFEVIGNIHENPELIK